MSAPRDELAELVQKSAAQTPADWLYEDEAKHVADAILAAGYRKPRTITTFEELDALPVDAVVGMLGTGHIAIKVWQSQHPRKDGTPLSEWLVTGDDSTQGTYDLAFPATVLHEPEVQS